MIFLLPRWDMLVPWRLFHFLPSPFLWLVSKAPYGLFCSSWAFAASSTCRHQRLLRPVVGPKKYSLRFFSIEVVFHRLVADVQFFFLLLLLLLWVPDIYLFVVVLPSPQEFQLPLRLLTLLAKASFMTGILGWGPVIPTYLVFVSVVQERALVINKNYWDGEFSHIGTKRCVKACEIMWSTAVDCDSRSAAGHSCRNFGVIPCYQSVQILGISLLSEKMCKRFVLVHFDQL